MVVRTTIIYGHPVNVKGGNQINGISSGAREKTVEFGTVT
jgi:hypothetical protein